MKRWKKILLIVAGVIVLAGIVLYSIKSYNQGVVTVQTAKVSKQDLTQMVTASGQIKPKDTVNINAEGFGKIVEIPVKEGDRVKKGQVLLRLESTQPAADVAAQRAWLQSSVQAVKSAEANFRSAQADLTRSRADFERAKLNWERAQGLFKEQLISRSEYDARKAEFESSQAAVDLASARVQQAKADLERARFGQQQAQATLTRASDVLHKTTYLAPLSGTVTTLPVHVGENVVPGIQNASGSFLMTIADTSVITAEVKVDETDIVNVKLGQDADVTIDAIPNKTFKGRVTEIGSSAIIRSTGLATSQVTAGSQEAKDFKVVVTLQDAPDNLRPGLSTTAKVVTATRKSIVAIPIQALTIRTQKELDEAEKAGQTKGKGGTTLAASKNAAASDDPKKDAKKEIQGVFVTGDRRAHFVPVTTGITGVTDIEVLSGLKEGDEIVTGSYKALRTLKPGARIKIDNKAKSGEEKEASSS
jgi:HlyD family secretion protein